MSNLQAFNSCNQETGKVAAIERDITAAKALDSPGTPTIVVNGQMLRFVPDSFQIEALLKRAKQDRTGS